MKGNDAVQYHTAKKLLSLNRDMIWWTWTNSLSEWNSGGEWRLRANQSFRPPLLLSLSHPAEAAACPRSSHTCRWAGCQTSPPASRSRCCCRCRPDGGAVGPRSGPSPWRCRPRWSCGGRGLPASFLPWSHWRAELLPAVMRESEVKLCSPPVTWCWRVLLTGYNIPAFLLENGRTHLTKTARRSWSWRGLLEVVLPAESI